MHDRGSEAEQPFDIQRETLVANLRRRGSFDDRTLNAMLSIPREAFVDPEFRHLSYEDNALPIAEGQTISQPTIVAMMTTALDTRPESNVLEIGTGSGYQAAVLSRLSRRVISVERHAKLLERASEILKRLEIGNVELHVGDGSQGWPQSAPYDRVLVTAASPDVPRLLLAQLHQRDGSRLVAPIGDQRSQQLVVVERVDGQWAVHSVGHVSFVPLRGESGWSEKDWDEGWKRRLRNRIHRPR